MVKYHTIDAFYQFTKEIAYSTTTSQNEQFEENTERDTLNTNAMGMAAVKLMNDSTIQNDTITRDGLQKKCGSFETTSNNG